MFKKVLIANRGAIACRVIRTLRRMDIRSVAVYAESDADSLHVQWADESYSLGEGAAAETYLNQDVLFTLAHQTGVEAIHPGYGFLSENPEFVRRCESEGFVFIGPELEHIEAFALKHRARQLAEKADVPLIPGSGLLPTLEDAIQSAVQISYPIILKSTAGGGGIGMQVCKDESCLRDAYDSVVRLSENNFADGGVFIEKYIPQARHIEVQVFGDGHGNAVALAERDCSLQRRNQKVIEETPAPDISDATRAALGKTAIDLVTSVNYANAGTVEFIYDTQTKAFYFLEVNTRLQVEHGVTEQLFNVDLVEWMLQQAAGEMRDLEQRAARLKPSGHAIEVRIYAEDPAKQFQPCAGLLSHVKFPYSDYKKVRVDSWIESGVQIPSYFDPMLAKIIVHADDRQSAVTQIRNALGQTELYGIETNLEYAKQVLAAEFFPNAKMHTRLLNEFSYSVPRINVLSPGTMTTIQDLPGRVAYWDVGVPPSGPFDRYSFALGNRLLGNPEDAAGLEITLNGPTLKFYVDTQVLIAGAEIDAKLDGRPLEMYRHIPVCSGQILQLGKVKNHGARSYLLVRGGIDCPDYLGSKSTFTLGQFGGHCGRAIRTGDVLHFALLPPSKALSIDAALIPALTKDWTLRVIYGPHGAPDFFTENDINTFFATRWQVHYNSSRTGIRLLGPKPEWARSDGGEAGMHPSNLHDNAYAFGTVDFTGDMPVILGPDGPSLGGFVCPATVIDADLWKLGQLKAGDTVRFESISHEDALILAAAQRRQLESLVLQQPAILGTPPETCVIDAFSDSSGVVWTIRPAGDRFLLLELGEHKLDLSLRLRVHCLMLQLQQAQLAGVEELTPGIRSLQIHYDPFTISRQALIRQLRSASNRLDDVGHLEMPSRIVHLPLSWDDEACRLAIEKYTQSVRADAPWCPSNIEFIRRINGLDSIEQVKQIVFDASYVVMGLGDVYLGAPVAVPIDPRHRLVTTKYNPARTWTAENSVGIGGSYLCVYGMEGPGGYQFIGRTLQMWNRYRKTEEFQQPWLLRFFDQIRFYEVSADELKQIRQDFPRGEYRIQIEQAQFSLAEYNTMLSSNAKSIASFIERREHAFAKELERWRKHGQLRYESNQSDLQESAVPEQLPDNCIAVESSVAGSVWQILVAAGDEVQMGEVLLILESMKMEIEITAPCAGTVNSINKSQGAAVAAGQLLLVMEQS